MDSSSAGKRSRFTDFSQTVAGAGGRRRTDTVQHGTGLSYCPECGTVLELDARPCAGCGFVPEVAPATPGPPNVRRTRRGRSPSGETSKRRREVHARPSGDKSMLLALCGLAGVAIVLGGVWLSGSLTTPESEVGAMEQDLAASSVAQAKRRTTLWKRYTQLRDADGEPDEGVWRALLSDARRQQHIHAYPCTAEIMTFSPMM